VVLASVSLQAPGYSRQQGHAVQVRLLRALEVLPGVAAVTLADWVPLTFSRHTEPILVEGYVPRLHESMDLRTAFVGPGYLGAMRVPLVSGRDFTAHDVDSAPRVCIVDRVFAERYWPGENAIGKRLQAGSRPSGGPSWREVVGVAEETRHQRLHEAGEPMVYVPLLQASRGSIVVHVRAAGDPQRLLPLVEKTIRATDPALPVFNVTTLDRSVRLGSMFERLAGTFVGVFGLVALALAAVGLYGVLAYSTRQRTREMGIRMALGAGQGEVLRLVLRQGAGLAAAGLALGLLAAAATTRFVRSLLFGVAETDLLTFAAVAVVLAAVALAACAVPAWRAARVQPLQALRHE
jgi:predicted permease